MTTQSISVTAPVGQAIERVKQVLFRPFNLGKWFVIGFCAWLALLGEGGGGGGGFHSGFKHDGGGWHGIRRGIEQLREFLAENLWWVLPVAIAIILVSLAIWVVVLWVSSRGRFMFLHCVALDVAQVEVPWAKFASEANSLFAFRLVVSLISLVLMLPLLGIFVLLIVGMALNNSVNVGGVLLAIALVFLMVALGIVFWMIGRLTTDFIVPIQALRRVRCLTAWQELREMLRGNIGNLLLYFLFRIVLAIAIGAIVITAVLVTCCIAGCLMAVPYIGTVLLLPILVFERAYSLYYLAQFGPGYDVFTGEMAPTV